jgi:hypothetical protein
MRRTTVSVFATILIGIGSMPLSLVAKAPTATSIGKRTPITKLEGAYLFDAWKSEPFRKAIGTIFNRTTLALFKRNTQVTGKMTRSGNFIIGSGQAPHSGGVDKAAIAVAVDGTKAYAVILQDRKTVTRLGYGSLAELPEGIRSAFREIEEP